MQGVRIYDQKKSKIDSVVLYNFHKLYTKLHVIYAVQEKKQVTGLISILAMLTLIVLSLELESVKVYAAIINEGTIVYEQPTDITQLSNMPLQIFIGLGVALAAIAILVLYKVRK